MTSYILSTQNNSSKIVTSLFEGPKELNGVATDRSLGSTTLNAKYNKHKSSTTSLVLNLTDSAEVAVKKALEEFIKVTSSEFITNNARAVNALINESLIDLLADIQLFISHTPMGHEQKAKLAYDATTDPSKNLQEQIAKQSKVVRNLRIKILDILHSDLSWDVKGDELYNGIMQIVKKSTIYVRSRSVLEDHLSLLLYRRFICMTFSSKDEVPFEILRNVKRISNRLETYYKFSRDGELKLKNHLGTEFEIYNPSLDNSEEFDCKIESPLLINWSKGLLQNSL